MKVNHNHVFQEFIKHEDTSWRLHQKHITSFKWKKKTALETF